MIAGGGSGTNSPETEEAIERGLAFLARYQERTVAGACKGFPRGPALDSDTAATALAVPGVSGGRATTTASSSTASGARRHRLLVKTRKTTAICFVPARRRVEPSSVWLYSHALPRSPCARPTA